ncbi:MAG: hypothetical protein NC308_10465, partial [Clostridium sp.]|nr:hypothetical protein [Clostridium sp.]
MQTEAAAMPSITIILKNMLKKYQFLDKWLNLRTIHPNNQISAMSDVLTEITPLSEKDCFHIVERHKSPFTYPLHQHKEFEQNFIE